MAEWDKNKVLPSEINGGKEFTTDDNLTVAELNLLVNNSFYGVDFVEAIADTPDTSEANNVGVPSVSVVDNGKFKKFKFSNLKGATGDKGAGISYIEKSATVGITTGYRIHFDDGNFFDYEVKNGKGIRDISKIRTDGLVDTYMIIYDDNITTSTFTVTNGAKGEKGDVGATFVYDSATKTLNIITE